MSKRTSPDLGRYDFPGTNLNDASGSMNRRMSHALAMRSTKTPSRVTHVCPRSVAPLTPRATASRTTPPASFSSSVIARAASGRPGAPKKSILPTSSSRRRSLAASSRPFDARAARASSA
jgi:hypothetical protein